VFTAQAEALAEYRGFEAANTEQKKRCEYDQSLKLFADLFILLTGSDYNLGWPTLSCREGESAQTFQLYFARHTARLFRRSYMRVVEMTA
jgi:hypothetical protein